MNRNSIILLLLFSTPALACKVKGPQEVIFNSEDGNSRPSTALSFSKCTNDQEGLLKSFINDFSGTLNNRILSLEDGLKNVHLENSIKITTLSEFLNERIKLPKDWRIIRPQFTGKHSSIITKEINQSINVECSLCQNTGTKTVKIELVDSINNRYQNTWINAEVAVKTQALFAKENLQVNNTPLTPSIFKLETLYSSKPEQFFLNKDKVIFYKLNKPIAKGEKLNYSDLTPVDLVRMGQPVSVILKNNSLRLESTATANQSGKLGQSIRLKNSRTNKVIIGKIIDFNKVEVEL